MHRSIDRDELMTTPTITASFNVGHRYRVTLSVLPDNAEIYAVWEPGVPRAMSPTEWQDYAAGRDAFVCKLSAVLGGRVAVIDL